MSWIPQGEAAVCAGSRSVPEEPETSCARTLTHYDVAVHPAVQGACALTFDVLGLRFGDAGGLGAQVCKLLNDARIQATFFIPVEALRPSADAAWLRELLKDGHELGCRLSNVDDSPADLEATLCTAIGVLSELQKPEAGRPPLERLHDSLGLSGSGPSSASAQPAPTEASCEPPGGLKWFRVPMGQASKPLWAAFNRLGISHVQGDCALNDANTKEIGAKLRQLSGSGNSSTRLASGSIVAIPVPEADAKNHWESCDVEGFITALRDFLNALSGRTLEAVSLRSLYERAFAHRPSCPARTAAVPSQLPKAGEQQPDADQAAASDAMPILTRVTSPLRMGFHKWCVTAASLTPREVLDFAFPGSLCYFDAKAYPGLNNGTYGLLALTLDDAPCSSNGKPMLNEIQQVLNEYGAKATFFLTTDYVAGHEAGLKALVEAGHEVANHCEADRPYDKDSRAEFEAALLRAEGICESLRHGHRRCRFFRAPWARMSPEMWEVLNLHGFTHILTDCYANDPWISDPTFLAKAMLKRACIGSIAVLHTPERGFREYNLEALRQFLQGLQEKKMRAVSLTELYEAAYGASKFKLW